MSWCVTRAMRRSRRWRSSCGPKIWKRRRSLPSGPSDAPGSAASTAVVMAGAGQTGVDPIALVREALADAGMNYISLVVEFPGGGWVVLHLIELGLAVEVTAGGIGLGSLVLVEGARSRAVAPPAGPGTARQARRI